MLQKAVQKLRPRLLRKRKISKSLDTNLCGIHKRGRRSKRAQETNLGKDVGAKIEGAINDLGMINESVVGRGRYSEDSVRSYVTTWVISPWT